MMGILETINKFKMISANWSAKRSISLTAINNKTHAPTNFERKLLVWSGKFKNIQDVPTIVSYETMQRCHNKMRIRVANVMIVGTIIGCIIMIISGKQAAQRGESVTKMNLDWHKEYNDAPDDLDQKQKDVQK